MEVISVDSNRIVGNSDVATVHSLRSLVSSDDSIHSLEQNDEIQSTVHCQTFKNCQDYCHHNAQRSSSTEMSIIACSSPEIKALVQPVPPSIQFHHQRSMSTLSLFPEDDRSDENCDINSIHVAKIKRISFPIVSPAASPNCENVKVGNIMKVNNDKRSLIERRDQESYYSKERFDYSKEFDAMKMNKVYEKETDKLALCLERQKFGSERICLPEVSNKDFEHSSQVFMTQNTAVTLVQQRPINRGHIRHQENPLIRRSSLHRRVSYDSLPEMSEILCRPDFNTT